MSTTVELQEMGWLSFGELAAKIARERHMNMRTLKSWLNGPLTKIRGNLYERQLVVEPDGREGYYMYHPSLVLPLVAYIKWHRLGGRHSMAKAMRFIDEFIAGEDKARKHLPPRLRNDEENDAPVARVFQLSSLKSA